MTQKYSSSSRSPLRARLRIQSWTRGSATRPEVSNQFAAKGCATRLFSGRVIEPGLFLCAADFFLQAGKSEVLLFLILPKALQL